MNNYKCPKCAKESKTEESCFPFCSDRCRLIDLGKWSTGEYSFEGEDGEATSLIDNSYNE